MNSDEWPPSPTSDAGGATDTVELDEPAPLPSRTTTLLVRVAGGDMRDLANSPADQSRFSLYGLSVLITTLMATVTMPIVLSIAIGHFSPLVIPFGLIWGLFIFNIDRWIVSALDYKSLRADLSVSRSDVARWLLRKTLAVTVRLALAVVIGLSISEPILLVVFNQEITKQIEAHRQDEVNTIDTNVEKDSTGKYATEKANLQKSITSAAKDAGEARQLYAAAQRELAAAEVSLACEKNPDGPGCTAAGRVGVSGVQGCAPPECVTRQDAVDRAEANVNATGRQVTVAAARVTRARRALVLKEGQDVRVSPDDDFFIGTTTIPEEMVKDKADAIAALPGERGFSVRENALSQLTKQDSSVDRTVWVVRALLLSFDTAPLLLKLATSTGQYEERARRRAARSVASAHREYTSHLKRDQQDRDRHDARHRRHSEARDKRDDLHTRLALAHDTEQLRRAHDLRVRRLVREHAWEVDRFEAEGAFRDAGFFTPDTFIEPEGVPQDGTGESDSDETGGTPAGGADGAPAPPVPEPGRRDPFTGGEGTAPEPLLGGRWRRDRWLEDADPGMVENRNGRPPSVVTDNEQEHLGEYVFKEIAQLDVQVGRKQAEMEIAVPAKDISDFTAPIIDKGKDDLSYFVVTPFYKNGSLQRRLVQAPPLQLGKVLQYAKETLTGLADALGTMDSEGTSYQLVHLDIKPPNLMLDDKGHIRIIDWGLASFLSAKHQLTYSDGRRRFTMWYAPPEQILAGYRGWPSRSWRSSWCDIRAVGAIVYEMFTGFRPLQLEAYWSSLLTPNGQVKNSNAVEARLYNMLAMQQPLAMLDFASHLEPEVLRRLQPLQNVVSTFLSPRASDRTGGGAAEPSLALQMLADAARPILDDPKLWTMEVGRHSLMSQPPPRKIDIQDNLAWDDDDDDDDDQKDFQ